MNRPPEGWKFTGRYYPDGVEVVEKIYNPKWIDLMWYDPKRDVFVYLSTKPITFWLDHIDGNAGNNDPSNFRFVCPNCDSQSETFGAKNKGFGRGSRGLKPYS